MNDTLQRIESLRQSLYALVRQHGGNLLHPAVVAASQCLDTEMFNWQQEQNTERHRIVSMRAVI